MCSENTAGILSLQPTSWDAANNVRHPRWLDPTMELTTYSFVLYPQHGHHNVKCKPSIGPDIRRAYANRANVCAVKVATYRYSPAVGVAEL